MAKLEDIAEINPRHPLDLNDTLKVTFVPMSAVSESSWTFQWTKEQSLGQVRKGYTHFAEGDVLFAKITPCMENGKAAIATGLKNNLGCGSTELHVVRPRPGIDCKYVYHFVHQGSFRREAAQNFTGTAGQLRVPVQFMREVELPVPPSKEQRRVVAKLESLLDKVDTCQKRLEKIPVILKRFRQSVLAAACSGRLTADWRGKNPSGVSVDTIVSKIRRTREAEAKSPSEKEKLHRAYKNIEENDSSELPEDWKFITLKKLCSSFDYGTSAKSQRSGKIPVLRMGNIQDGQLDWTDLVYTSDKNEIKKYYLQPNTVLFNRTNSPELVGKTAIYRGEQPAIFAGYLIRANPCPELDPEYLNLCLNTTYAKEYCASVKSDGVSQSNINAQKLGAFEMPFCHLSEQQEIVRRVEALFAFADQIEARYAKAKTHVDKVSQSILAKAFRGELVPQDPNDEPASLLLERVRTGRAEAAVDRPVKSTKRPQRKDIKKARRRNVKALVKR